MRPNWAFSPLVEASGYALQLGIRPYQLLESGVELLNVLRQCGQGESRDSRDQEKEPVYRDRGHGAAKTTAYWKCVHVSSPKLLYCIEQLAYCYTNLPMNTASFTAALRVCSDPTAFAVCLEISANLRKPGELTNPPVEGRPQ